MLQKIKSYSQKWFTKPLSDKVEKALNLPKPIHDNLQNIKLQVVEHPCKAYMQLKHAFRDSGRMNAIIETIGRDFLTAMPDGAYISRLGQIAFMYRRMHEDLSKPELVDMLKDAKMHAMQNSEIWDEWDSANLREMETTIRHHTGVPADLIEKRARLTYEGRHVHRDVLKHNDWDRAKTFLEGMVELSQQIADAKQLEDNNHKESRYQALLREFMPGARIDEIDRLFTGYKSELEIILPQIMAAQKSRGEPLEMDGVFAGKSQMWLNRAMLKMIGFDFERGGLYETGHNPVEGGTPDDTRFVIKTAKIGTFLDSLKSALHEGGHGIYIQGLPRKHWRYQPIGQDLGALVHESQALLIEMILGRKLEFFNYLAPRAEGLFQRFGDPSLTAENLWKLKNRVALSPDRKSADEVTYFLHIHMRTQIERQLISGDIKVADLPDVWAHYSKEYFGAKPKSNAEGCLQDVHWFVGKFGYFPSYALGHMMAAQLYETMERDIPHIPTLLNKGEFGDIHKWLEERIYRQGRLMKTDELIKNVTGRDLSYDALVRHTKKRYLR
jgi:carboxypeptidase Taq